MLNKVSKTEDGNHVSCENRQPAFRLSLDEGKAAAEQGGTNSTFIVSLAFLISPLIFPLQAFCMLHQEGKDDQ